MMEVEMEAAVSKTMTTTTTHQNHHRHQLLEPSIETDKLSYEIFSILESKFLFGYDDDRNNSSNENNDDNHPFPVPPPPPPPPPRAFIPKTQRGKVCVLTIDSAGAGMRGVMVGKALCHLERSLRSVSGDPDARISDYFDLAAGTGVGGIFTAMLFGGGKGRTVYHADDTWKFLTEKGERFFFRRRRKRQRSPSLLRCVVGGGQRRIATATAGMERSLKETLGEEITLRETVKPVLIPCYDLRSSAPFVFSRADALESESYDFRLWEVCRATSAEPGMFEPVELRSVDGLTTCVGIDGGLVMSNPAAAAITHVLHNKQEFPFVRGVEDLLVLSLGAAGGGEMVFTEKDLDFENVRRWKAKDWARPATKIATDGTADLVDHAVAMAFSHSRSSSNYARIQANLTGLAANVDCDSNSKNVKKLLHLAEETLNQKNVESILFGGMKKIGERTNSEKLDSFARELVSEHRSRGDRIAPTVAFKQLESTSTA